MLEHQISYWKQQLAGAPALLELPTDHPRPHKQTFSGARQWFVVDAPLRDALTALGRQESATLFMTLLAAFKTLLYRMTGQKDMVVGTDVANRDRFETRDLIGFFVNLLAGWIPCTMRL